MYWAVQRERARVFGSSPEGHPTHTLFLPCHSPLESIAKHSVPLNMESSIMTAVARTASILDWVRQAKSKYPAPYSSGITHDMGSSNGPSRAAIALGTPPGEALLVPLRAWPLASKFATLSFGRTKADRNKMSITLERDSKFRHCALGAEEHNICVLPEGFTWVVSQEDGELLESYAFPGETAVSIASDGEDVSGHHNSISREAMQLRAPWELVLHGFRDDDGTWIELDSSAAVKAGQDTHRDPMTATTE